MESKGPRFFFRGSGVDYFDSKKQVIEQLGSVFGRSVARLGS